MNPENFGVSKNLNEIPTFHLIGKKMNLKQTKSSPVCV